MDAATTLSLNVTDVAAFKIRKFLEKEKNNLKFRVYITGGGCSGFQYGFIFDEVINWDDIIVKTKGISIVIDSMSMQYLSDSLIDYKEELNGTRFIVINPNAVITCSCGSSFSI